MLSPEARPPPLRFSDGEGPPSPARSPAPQARGPGLQPGLRLRLPGERARGAVGCPTCPACPPDSGEVWAASRGLRVSCAHCRYTHTHICILCLSPCVHMYTWTYEFTLTNCRLQVGVAARAVDMCVYTYVHTYVSVCRHSYSFISLEREIYYKDIRNWLTQLWELRSPLICPCRPGAQESQSLNQGPKAGEDDVLLAPTLS